MAMDRIRKAWAVGAAAASLAMATLPLGVQAAEGYAVNILSRSQEALSNQFAKASTDKWANVAHSIGHAEALAFALQHGLIADENHLDVEFFGRLQGTLDTGRVRPGAAPRSRAENHDRGRACPVR